MNELPAKPKKNFIMAWFIGGIIYLWFAIPVIADAGFLAIPFQLIIGAVFSVACVGIAFLLGYIFRVPIFGRLWYSTPIAPLALGTLAAIAIIYGTDLGLTITLKSPETGATYKTLHPLVAYGSWLMIVFSALHFSTGYYFSGKRCRNT